MSTQQFILVGPPGSGVRAQAAALAERWHIPHVSMGKLVREAIANASAIGVEARAYVEAGERVPDELAIKLIRKRFEQPDTMLNGWVLDGFPRTLAQAQAFDEWWLAMGQPMATAVELQVITGLLLNRLAAEPGQAESLSSLRQRLALHGAETAPLLEYYRQRSQLKTVNANLSFAEVAWALAQLGEGESGAARLIQDEAELDALLAEKPRLVVEFMASWCGSCKRVMPSIDKLAEAYGDRVTVMKIDFDANRQISKRFELKGIPAVMFFKHGERLETLTGVKSYQDYNAAVTRLLE